MKCHVQRNFIYLSSSMVFNQFILYLKIFMNNIKLPNIHEVLDNEARSQHMQSISDTHIGIMLAFWV